MLIDSPDNSAQYNTTSPLLTTRAQILHSPNANASPSKSSKKETKNEFNAALAILLNHALNDWTSLSVICFGVCELSIRCAFAQLNSSAGLPSDKD
ncbi:hypothetical protein Ddc_03746 [Ditylenchus destructor]|nr:hypothetical protein Ddc_03746 [Ditylenchus destructor]